MKKRMSTSIAFIKNLFTTGAITESSEETAKEVCKYLPKEEGKVIVEFGMGHGNIAREILNCISSTSKVYAFEVNDDFCAYVNKSIDDKRLIIINDGAENLNNHVMEEVHAVVGSIPYSFFSKEKQFQIIQGAYDGLAKNAYYSQILYSKLNFKKFQSIFNHCILTTTRNIPKGYIYHCKKEFHQT